MATLAHMRHGLPRGGAFVHALFSGDAEACLVQLLKVGGQQNLKREFSP